MQDDTAEPKDDGASESEEIPPSLKTYAGIAVLTTMLVGMAKKFFADKIKGKEAWLAIAIPVALGAIAKLTNMGFSEVEWVTHIVALVMSGVGSGLIHDKVTNPLMKDKSGNGETPPTS